MCKVQKSFFQQLDSKYSIFMIDCISLFIFSLSEGRLLCIIEIKDKDICESATARSYKNAKNFAASKVLKKLTEK